MPSAVPEPATIFCGQPNIVATSTPEPATASVDQHKLTPTAILEPPSTSFNQPHQMATAPMDIPSETEEPMPTQHNHTPASSAEQDVEISSLIRTFLIVLCKWQLSNNVSDSAMGGLLSILSVFLGLLALLCAQVRGVAYMFPNTLYKMKQWLSVDCNDYTQFVVCPNPECAALYRVHDVISVDKQGISSAKLCKNQLFSSGKYSKACGFKLMKRVIVNNEVSFKPLKVYCHNSVITGLESLLMRPDILSRCGEWRNRKVPGGVYADIYDGNVWKEFGKENDSAKSFFEKSLFNFGFILNIDWLQPYDRRSDISIGVIYLALQNLPREIRYKKENCIVVGVIPNMAKEPNLDQLLIPLVKDLNRLWTGLKLRTASSITGVYVRGALITVSCDIPACHKVLGFMGHSAKQACSKCTKVFEGSVGCIDCSGFNDVWPGRTVKKHREIAHELKNNNFSKTSSKSFSAKHGYKTSPLLDLPYFNTVRYHTIDPMHNLFTRTAKHMWKHWSLTLSLFTPSQLQEINSRLTTISSTADNGWSPKNIVSNWGAWTAYEWKAWTLSYSLFCLQGVLDEKHLKAWSTFVNACRHLVKPCVNKTDVDLSHFMFKKFGNEIEGLYGKEFVTPNNHLHLHLRECVFDFGPVHTYWLFAFERFNYYVGVMNTNKKDIEVQIMRNVVKERELQKLLCNVNGVTKLLVQTVEKVSCKKYSYETMLMPDAELNQLETQWKITDHIVLNEGIGDVAVLNDIESNKLLQCYKSMYKHTKFDEDIVRQCLKLKHVSVGNDQFHSVSFGQGLRHGRTMASWHGENGEISTEAELRPCKVKYFIRHSLSIGSSWQIHVFAIVDWFVKCNNNVYKHPLSVWEEKKYETFGPASFLPVQRLSCKFTSVTLPSGQMVVSPLPQSVFI